ncbi:MAG: DUF4307 domain-containing protein [Kineosporiaceae bacterium]
MTDRDREAPQTPGAAAEPGPAPADDDVAARYAGPRAGAGARRRLTVAAAAAAVVLLLVLGWFAFAVLDRDVRWQTVTFEVTGPERVEVTFEVYGRAGDRVRCLVRATADDFADVGQREVDLGPLPAGGDLRVTTTVRTIAPGANAGVRTCAVLPDALS